LKLTPQKSSYDDSNLDEPVRVVSQVTTSVSALKDIMNYCFQLNNLMKPDCLKDFLVASLLMQSKINVIVLLAGTSGTGKSTLASLLGTRLGISTVLSTDSVRHVMRNFLKEEDNPTLFCSTYEAGKTVSEEESQNASKKQITLKGYKKQCALVTKELAKVIDQCY
jgi:2-phosphoglycerate kinase